MIMGKHEDDDRVYEDVPFEDLDYCDDDEMYYYRCPCGDMFELSKVRACIHLASVCPSPSRTRCTLPHPRNVLSLPLLRAQDDFEAGKRIAHCPSCSLKVRVICGDDPPAAPDGEAQPVLIKAAAAS